MPELPRQLRLDPDEALLARVSFNPGDDLLIAYAAVAEHAFPDQWRRETAR